MVDRNEVFKAADEIRSEGGLVAQTSVMAPLAVNTGRKGSPRDVGPYVLQWKADRNYAPAAERGGVPAAVSAQIGKATATLWAAARAEAARAFQVDRERLEATLGDERVLRAEALATAEGLLGRVEDTDGGVPRMTMPDMPALAVAGRLTLTRETCVGL